MTPHISQGVRKYDEKKTIREMWRQKAASDEPRQKSGRDSRGKMATRALRTRHDRLEFQKKTLHGRFRTGSKKRRAEKISKYAKYKR